MPFYQVHVELNCYALVDVEAKTEEAAEEMVSEMWRTNDGRNEIINAAILNNLYLSEVYGATETR